MEGDGSVLQQLVLAVTARAALHQGTALHHRWRGDQQRPGRVASPRQRKQPFPVAGELFRAPGAAARLRAGPFRARLFLGQETWSIPPRRAPCSAKMRCPGSSSGPSSPTAPSSHRCRTYLGLASRRRRTAAAARSRPGSAGSCERRCSRWPRPRMRGSRSSTRRTSGEKACGWTRANSATRRPESTEQPCCGIASCAASRRGRPTSAAQRIRTCCATRALYAIAQPRRTRMCWSRPER